MTVIACNASAGNLDRGADPSTRWVKDEQDAIRIAATHDGPIIVDLDETLYLRNSTEQFIALASPNILAALSLYALSAIKPWRWAGGESCRDNWRVMVILVLFPWTIIRWRSFCARGARDFVNRDLEQALRAGGGNVIIASNGYRRIIEPLVLAMDLPHSLLICCNIRRFNHRTGGKLELVRPFIDEDAIAASAVITDSISDKALLSVCAVPCLTVWAKARYERAFAGLIYYPGYYLSKIKRPGRSALKSLILNDLLVWILVGSAATFDVPRTLGLALLFLSMWAFYEIGYYDNDVCALKYEDDPVVSNEMRSGVATSFPRRATTAGVLFGAGGIYLLQPSNFIYYSATWLFAMLALVMTYRSYNRIDKQSRVWLYLPLQVFRSASLFLIVGGGHVAFAVVGSQIIARWIDYIVYRHQHYAAGGASFPERPQKTVRLMTCTLFLSAVVITEGFEALLIPATLCLPYFAFVAMRAEIPAIMAGLRRLDSKVAAHP